VADRTLLVVSRRPLEFGGGGSARWQHLRSALPRHGWRVVECSPRVGLTANESSTDPRAARLAAGRAEVMAVVGRSIDPLARLLRVKPEAFAPNNAWALTGRRLVRNAIARERPDVVVATSPPPSALFATASVAGNTPFVADVRDLWAGNPYYDRGSRVLASLQGRALSGTAAVVTVTEGCRVNLLALHPELKARLRVFPNGFDPTLLGRRLPMAPRGDGPATLIHAGALYGDRAPRALLNALARPEMQGRVQLQLLGAVDGQTRTMVKGLPEVDVTISAPIPWDGAIECVLAADVAVVINAPETGGDMALPTKLFEALALGRPVLALARAGSDTARLLEHFGLQAGVADPGDARAIAVAIERLLADPPPPVPPEALAEFDRDRIAARYAALLDDVATRSSNATSSGTTFSRR
jgi:glycosyltransferase involved in cell wall biosynthesis